MWRAAQHAVRRGVRMGVAPMMGAIAAPTRHVVTRAMHSHGHRAVTQTWRAVGTRVAAPARMGIWPSREPAALHGSRVLVRPYSQAASKHGAASDAAAAPAASDDAAPAAGRPTGKATDEEKRKYEEFVREDEEQRKRDEKEGKSYTPVSDLFLFGNISWRFALSVLLIMMGADVVMAYQGHRKRVGRLIRDQFLDGVTLSDDEVLTRVACGEDVSTESGARANEGGDDADDADAEYEWVEVEVPVAEAEAEEARAAAAAAPGVKWMQRTEDALAVWAVLHQFVHKQENTQYHVVYGKRGSGKSSLMRAVCHEEGSGVAYVEVGSDLNEWPIDFAHAVGFGFDEELSFLDVVKERVFGIQRKMDNKPEGKPGQENLARLLPFLADGGRKVKVQTGRRAVLVLDNVEHLARDPAMLRQVQDWAEQCSTANTISVFFVTNDADTLRQLQRNAAERGDMGHLGRVLTVGDVSDEEAVAYLRKCGVAQPDALQLVTRHTGGQVMALRYAARALLEEGKNVDEVREALRTRAEAVVHKTSGFSLAEDAANCRSVYGWAMLKLLATAHGHTVPAHVLEMRFDDADTARDVLSAPAFVYDPVAQTYALQSRALRTLVREEVGVANTKQERKYGKLFDGVRKRQQCNAVRT